ncbi:transcriptional regulator AryK [Macrococcus brunensis]|uniref:transcriptional regulator AryK n=1 Tax=Macrococcus brunensis TaxID=198483 RepID=UPI001EF0F774|nr:helix-turn-helix domain-containing protein [Macrococcus brunensis]ULG71402.1 helix-turn-helix domain-containing protein [Macrococcus brunensis]
MEAVEHYNITFNQERQNTISRSNGLRLILILKGEMNCTINEVQGSYSAGDIILLNHRDSYSFSHLADAYISLNIRYFFIKKMIDHYALQSFDFTSVSMNHQFHVKLQDILAKIGMISLRKISNYRLHIEQQIMELLLTLSRNVPRIQTRMNEEDSTDIRLMRVRQYIDEHYHETINLQQVADLVDLSPAYLSKLFRQKMNTGFNHYVSSVRLEQVLIDLTYTQTAITDIALKNGFSNSAILSRFFKKRMGMTPSEYRHKHHVKKEKLTPRTFSDREYLLLLSQFVRTEDQKMTQPPELDQLIEIELSPVMGKLKTFSHIIQIGNLDALLVEQYKEQLIHCKNKIGVSTVLVDDPVKSKDLIRNESPTDEQIANIQRYGKLDACLDFLAEHRIDLAIYLKPDRGEIASYLTQLESMMRHIVMRMNLGDEFNIKFYIRNLDINQFEKIAQVIRTFIPTPQLLLHLDFERSHDVLAVLKAYEPLVEKIVFDANQNDLVNLDEANDEIFEAASHHIVDKSLKVLSWMEQHHITKPLVLLNWNTLTGDTNLTNGEYFRGGLIFEQFLQINSHIDEIGYWLNFELHESKALNHRSYMNSIELFHQYNGKRPAYFTSYLFKKLKSDIRLIKDHCLVVGVEHHFQVVVYDAEHYNPYLSLNKTDSYLRNKEITLHIKHLAEGTYRIKHYTLDKSNGALYSVWQSFNTRAGIDAESIEYINRLSYPKLEVSESEIKENLFYHLVVQTNAIHLIDIKMYL